MCRIEHHEARPNVGCSHVVAGAVDPLIPLWSTGWIAEQFTARARTRRSLKWAGTSIGASGNSGHSPTCRLVGVAAGDASVLALVTKGETPTDGEIARFRRDGSGQICAKAQQRRKEMPRPGLPGNPNGGGLSSERAVRSDEVGSRAVESVEQRPIGSQDTDKLQRINSRAMERKDRRPTHSTE